ncbi:MAG TPA: DUF5668 domain-containing protein [Clostridia bacterium]|nr:DUF5668 domain-containing protein [Clostridia bacterium]
MDKRNIYLGTALILAGCLLFSNQFFDFNFFSMEYFWPVFVLIPGLIFEASFFLSGRNAGLLVPGGILTTIGTLFFFETFTGWRFAEYTWPVYILAVAIGLAQLYMFGTRQRGLLIPVFILTLIAMVSFVMAVFGGIMSWLNYNTVLPVALILIGLYILVTRSSSSERR